MARPSGTQRRKLRVARGLPARGEVEAGKWRESNRKRAHERRATNLAWLAAYKLDKGCADCGYDQHLAALHFDHLPGHGKAGNLSRMTMCGRERLLAEIAKCEVVCANCHAIRTYNRRLQAAG
jgi:hypothetical protein